MDQKEREALEQIYIEMVAIENLLPLTLETEELRQRFRRLATQIKKLAEEQNGSG